MAEKTAFELALDGDLDNAFFSEFTTSVTVKPTSIPSYIIKAVFDSAYLLTTPDTNEGVQSVHPVLHINDNSMHHEIKQDTETVFEIKGKEYKIREVQPDGVGTTMVMLRAK